jgi:broad specificity phosphatase PhoE
MRLKAALLFAGLPLLGLQPLSAQEGVEIFLVRHAEKADDGTSNPHLTPAGEERARLLAFMLKDAGITHVHSSGFHRTLETAAPLAEAMDAEVAVYDTGALEELARELKATPGRHLVVGHSNTTPNLVAALGGDPGSPIDELSEYDRLYLVTVGPEGGVETVLLRFGDPFEG